MLEGKPAIGAAAGLGAPLGAEILSHAGYDYVMVDNQHGAWDEIGTMLAIRSICLGSAVPMARVRKNDYCAIGRLLDIGMLGIVVPMVNSVAEAEAAAYAARYIAKNIVAAGLAERLELQVAYVIGVSHPLSVSVETFGTGKITQETLVNLINKHFDLRPAAIIRDFNLRRPIYRQTAAYGHFGRDDLDLPWEKTDKADILKKEALG